MNQKTKISIITITYNAEDFIEETIKSVLNQSYKEIEYIIVDGGSKDKTNEIIAHYKDNIAVYISEEDKGIYDAMNKGLKLATGDFIWFINAGDKIYDSQTVEKIFHEYKDEDAFYGETQLVHENGKDSIITPVPKVLTWKSFVHGMATSHQSIIFKRENVKPYSMEYKIIADQDWIIDALQKSKKIKNTEIILSRYLLGGFSAKNFKTLKKERLLIAQKYYGFFGLLLNHYYLFIEEIKNKIRPYIKRGK